MKKSVIMILAALAFILLIMLAFLIGVRITVKKAIGMRTSEESALNYGGYDENLNLKDVDSIKIDGAWYVSIKQGNDPGITCDIPESHRDKIYMYVKDGRLFLGDSRSSGDFIDENDDKNAFRASVVLPALNDITLSGSGSVSFSGFQEEVLDIVMEGMGKVIGEDSSVDNLSVYLDGLGEVDAMGVPAGNVYAELDGLGKILVNIDGGVLDGLLDGMGSIIYYGDLKDNRVEINGLGKVKPGF